MRSSEFGRAEDRNDTGANSASPCAGFDVLTRKCSRRIPGELPKRASSPLSSPAPAQLTPGELGRTTPIALLWRNQTDVGYFSMPAKVFAKVWTSPGHLAET
jgi:hypothetical protein